MNIIGHVEGKTCVLIDDMIDSGDNFSAANALKEAGAKDVYAFCTHPVLSGPALQRIEDSAIERLVVTDSIYLSDDRKIVKIDEVSVGELIEMRLNVSTKTNQLVRYLKQNNIKTRPHHFSDVGGFFVYYKLFNSK